MMPSAWTDPTAGSARTARSPRPPRWPSCCRPPGTTRQAHTATGRARVWRGERGQPGDSHQEPGDRRQRRLPDRHGHRAVALGASSLRSGRRDGTDHHDRQRQDRAEGRPLDRAQGEEQRQVGREEDDGEAAQAEERQGSGQHGPRAHPVGEDAGAERRQHAGQQVQARQEQDLGRAQAVVRLDRRQRGRDALHPDDGDPGPDARHEDERRRRPPPGSSRAPVGGPGGSDVSPGPGASPRGTLSRSPDAPAARRRARRRPRRTARPAPSRPRPRRPSTVGGPA